MVFWTQLRILLKIKKRTCVLLQETHLTPVEHGKLKRMGFSKVYYSSYRSGHRRRVTILISQKWSVDYLSEISDKEGRYIIILGKIDAIIVTICIINASPENDFAFYRKIFDLMIGPKGIVSCGGDWNICLNPKLDSSKNSLNSTLLHRKINVIMAELGVLDLWRDFCPSGRDYTFYSCPHDVYSRIEYFLY